jgi:hypothetical protein
MSGHRYRALCVVALAMLGASTTGFATGLDPAAVTYTPLDNIQWKDNAAGTTRARQSMATRASRSRTRCT